MFCHWSWIGGLLFNQFLVIARLIIFKQIFIPKWKKCTRYLTQEHNLKRSYASSLTLAETNVIKFRVRVGHVAVLKGFYHMQYFIAASWCCRSLFCCSHTTNKKMINNHFFLLSQFNTFATLQLVLPKCVCVFMYFTWNYMKHIKLCI